MCGRYTLTKALSDIAERFLFNPAGVEYGPRYNIAPSQQAPVVRAAGDGTRELSLLQWGLVPQWADDKSIGNRLINARGETVAEKPSFRRAFKSQRCLVLADGFYEWVKHDSGKQPVFIHLPERAPFAFAGLWERWDKGGDGTPLETYTIITTSPTEEIKQLHHRMPVILREEVEDLWLTPASRREELEQLLRPYPGTPLEHFAVGKEVNSPANDHPQLLARQESLL
jgi:putative SOS response-associated peptidase YedK